MGLLIVVVISIATLILQREGVQPAVVDAMTGLLGNKGGEAINTTLQAAGKPSESIFATVIGTATFVHEKCFSDASGGRWPIGDERCGRGSFTPPAYCPYR